MRLCIAILLLILVSVFMPACAPAQGDSPTDLGPEPTAPANPPAITVAAASVESAALEQQRAQLYAADEVARLTAIAQIEADGSPAAVMILGAFFMDADVRGRLEAARALLRINTTQAQNYVRTAMSDKQLTGRRQVVMQALEANGEASYPILRLLITDDDETVRLNTVQVVEFMGTAQGRVLLQQAMNDSSPTVRQAAIDALRALGFAPSPTP